MKHTYYPAIRAGWRLPEQWPGRRLLVALWCWL
jgi:hypothetical protein